MSKQVLLQLRDISHTYPQGKKQLRVLNQVNLELSAGEIVALVGPSGAGKSTLLHIAGLLERPSQGEVHIHGESTQSLPDRKRTRLRRSTVGFVYQFHHLLPEFTALENVILPQLLRDVPYAQAQQHAHTLIDNMGLSERELHLPSQLSGGEQQRIAIVRALANNPQLLLADEPTGNLDTHTSHKVFAQLITLVREKKMAALVATHNPELAALMDRTLTLVDGKLV